MSSQRIYKSINKILIANRGEISCRVSQTAHKMGILTTAVYSTYDKNAMHVHQADEAINLGDSPLTDSYLNQQKLVQAALQCNADAIHPGYGFLSENYEFAKLCTDNGLIFIGPPASAIKAMGIKSLAKQLMSDANVPIIPGYHQDDQNESLLASKAKEIGFPIMIKAIKGGGGKGMRISYSKNDFPTQLVSAKRESLKVFGDDTVLIEKLIINPRHIEVQIFSDLYQNCVYLFERECSVQRRHQKLIEEAPGPGISEMTRQKLGKAAVDAARAVNYVGAGTVEFIYDNSNDQFYFMEMNTRIQVEHPVTEMITGTDLVEWQIRVARGEKLPLTQEEIQLKGHSFEARIYAENPENDFLPCAGLLHEIILPKFDKDVRIETGIRSGDEVSVHYDPLISKLVVWSNDRASALIKLKHCLRQFNVLGIKTNINFLHRLVSHPKFVEGKVDTNFIQDYNDDLFSQKTEKSTMFHIAVAAVGYYLNESNKYLDTKSAFKHDSFRLNKLTKTTRMFTFTHNSKDHKISVTTHNDGSLQIQVDNETIDIKSATLDCDHNLIIESDIRRLNFRLIVHENSIGLFGDNINSLYLENKLEYFDQIGKSSDIVDTSTKVVAPMPGIIEKVLVQEGQQVEVSQPLIVMMAMKLEFVIKAHRKSLVNKIFFEKGESVQKDSILIMLKDTN